MRSWGVSVKSTPELFAGREICSPKLEELPNVGLLPKLPVPAPKSGLLPKFGAAAANAGLLPKVGAVAANAGLLPKVGDPKPAVELPFFENDEVDEEV